MFLTVKQNKSLVFPLAALMSRSGENLDRSLLKHPRSGAPHMWGGGLSGPLKLHLAANALQRPRRGGGIGCSSCCR